MRRRCRAPAAARLAALLATLLAALLAARAGAQPSGEVQYRRSYRACARAYQRCDWAFLNRSALPTLDVSGPPDAPFSPPLVSRNRSERLTVVNANNAFTEFVFAGGVLLPSVYLARPRFALSSFKPRHSRAGPRLAHERFEGDQLRVASGACLRTYFSEFQLVVRGRVLNRRVARFDRKCVVYWTRAAPPPTPPPPTPPPPTPPPPTPPPQ